MGDKMEETRFMMSVDMKISKMCDLLTAILNELKKTNGEPNELK